MMLVEELVATLVAILLGTPGCEIGVWTELISRVRRSGSLPGEGLACIVGLQFIDRWEARRRDARARVAPTMRR